MKTLRRHCPQCECVARVDYAVKEHRNGTLHLRQKCTQCGKVASYASPRSSIRPSKWRALVATHLAEKQRASMSLFEEVSP